MNDYDLVFIYGTLKQGGGRHHIIKEHRYLGTAYSTPDYKMIAPGPYPAVTQCRPGTIVAGELWEIPVEVLDKQLDAVEGVADNLYVRSKITILQYNLVHLPLSEHVYNALNSKIATTYLWHPSQSKNHQEIESGFWGFFV